MKWWPTIVCATLLGCGADATDEPDSGNDGGPDAGDTDTGEPECTSQDTFDPADCPDMSDWPGCIVYVDADATVDGDGRSC